MLLAAWLGQPAPAAAHRLDEYLQATRVAIALDRVDLEIDLTPGAAMAGTVFGSIDSNGDGHISVAEGDAYAKEVLGGVSVSADGGGAVVRFIDGRFPDFAEMAAGLGTIRLRSVATIPRVAPGRHSITFANAHRPDSSVYLANALVPADRRITITAQHRDPAQHVLTLEYDVAYGALPKTLSVLAGLAVVCGLALVRRPRAGRERRGESLASSPPR